MNGPSVPEAEPAAPGSIGAGPDDVARPSAPAASCRKEAILAAACEQFARYGFRGASLRHIARDAGVSLTLLNHHFHNKVGLLSAVMAANLWMLRQRADVLRTLQAGGLDVLEPRELVRRWAAVAFDAAERADGRRFLRLVARMVDDAAPEARPLRDQLADEAALFVDVLMTCHPRASRRAATSTVVCVSAALLSFVTGAEGMAAGARERALVERLLVAGIEAALAMPEPEADEESSGGVETPPDTGREASCALS